MADTYYPIPENPAYNSQIRALQNDDPANAEETFNPLFERLIENTEAVKLSIDNTIPNSQKAEANGIASLDENGKVPLEQIPEGIGMHPRIDVTVSASTTVSVKSDTTTLTQTGTDVVSFDIPHFGTWTVTAGNYKRVVEVDTVKVYEIMALPLGSTSWKTIAEISASGKASSIWSIGDEFEKYISGLGERLTFVIVGFDQDDIAGDRGKAGITFGMKNLSKTLRSMESTNTNANSFTGSNLYKWLESICTDGNFGYDLIHAMKKINKRTSEGNTSKNIRTDAVKLFLFSKGEVFGYAAVEGEGLQYPYFATASNRTKYLDNGAGAASVWWLRSPYPSSNEKFECVSSSGDSSVLGSSATSKYGVCFGFCV